MAYEILKNIVNAEKQAEEIKANAILEADNIKSDCSKKIDALYAEVKTKAKAEEEKLINSAVDKTKNRAKEIADKAAELCVKIENESKLKEAAAIEAVIGKVVGKNGNS